MKPWLLYDVKIKQIPYTGGEKEVGLLYCDGWRDYSNMDITVICSYNYADDSYGVFLKDNLDDFQELVDKSEEIVGFNSESFNDEVCRANGLRIKTTYDLLKETYRAAGLKSPPPWDDLKQKEDAGDTEAKRQRDIYRGFKLQDIAIANLGVGNLGNGDNATKLWQQGQYGKVTNYCMRDVWLEKQIFDKRDCLISPVDNSVELFLRDPNSVELFLRDPKLFSGF